MTIYKKAIFSRQCSIKALNKPKGEGWDIFELPDQIKTASINIDGEDLDGFDLKEATKEHPDHLYIKIFAIKKDEPNDNGDAFDEKELKQAASTFIGVPLFANHQNDDVEKARGECVHSWYDKKEGGIYIIGRVDKIAYPRLARGVEEGYITGTSMGCSVESSLCSVCHNKASVAEDYCSHIENRKNRKFSGERKCAYHESPVDKEEKCPLCGSTKDNVKTLKHSEQQIYEHNYGLKFIENSFVVNPACHTCGVKCVLHIPTLQKKVASFTNTINNLIKESYLNTEQNEVITKLGGINELNALKNSMSQMETVVKSMLKQKENVSMEYVSDLVKAMADVQGIFDELVEMGYGALASPEVTAGEEPPIVTDQFPEAIPPQNLAVPQGATPSGSQTSDLGGLGNVTLPKKSSRKIEDFSEINKSIINKISSLEENLHTLYEKVNSKLDIGAKMAIENKNTKTAAGAENREVITEKQLAKEEDLSPRQGEAYEAITESKEQIGGEEKRNDTTSTSPQVRMGTYETITEDQLKTESALGDAVVHFNDYPGVITEKQWTDFSGDIASNLPDDYTESITEAQIRDLLSNHKFVGDLETITEDQMKNISMTEGMKRWSNKDYSLSLVKIATNLIADVISKYRKSPEEIKKASALINDDINIKSKVSFLAVVNSIPQKRDNLEAIASNIAYFSKTASQNNLSTIDSLIFSASENGKLGMKAEDVFDTVHHIINNESAMTKVDSLVKNKLNKVDDKNFITKADALESAIKEMDKPEDGKYQIKATMEDIGVPITDKVAFVDGVKKFAQEMIADDSVAAAVIKIEVGENGELIIDIQDGATEEIGPDDIGDVIENTVDDIDADINGDTNGDINGGEEKVEETEECAFAEKKENTKVAEAKTEIKKKAQMMGGEMGGQGGVGQAPGAGATLPAAPPAANPPLENFTEEGEFGEEEGGGLDETAEPLPPGSICPVCGSDDVDIISGKGKCNNCGSEMTYKVEVNVSKWQGVTPGDEEQEIAEEGFEGEGFEMPSEEEMGAVPGEEMGAIPAAASISNWKINKFATVIHLKPEIVKKAAESNIKIGSISPSTGKNNTINMGEGTHVCLDTGTKYKVSYMVSKDGKQVYGQWEWEPKIANAICPSCSRAKQKFVKALSTIDLKESDFNKLSLKEQVETIIKLKQAGELKPIKTASKEGSVLKDYKLAYGNYGDKFPIESCIEKLSRRFGKNAVCLSGPDEGKPLAESVCNRLKGADIYTSKIASRVAESWSDTDGDEECITHQVRSGYGLRQAAEVCSALKIAVADGEDFLADGLAGEETFDDTPIEEPGIIEEVDPFEQGEGEEETGTVTLELPIDVVEQLGEQVDAALGEEAPIEEGLGEEIPIEEGLGEETPIEEVAPDELGTEEVKPCTEFEGDLPEECGQIEKKEGIPEDTSKVVIKIDGNPINGNPINENPINENPINAEEDTNIKESDIKEIPVMINSIGKVGKLQMDLSGVIATLNKEAQTEIVQEKAQDSKDIGTYTAGPEGSKMGHEDETIPSAQKPSIPRDQATMGEEPPELNPQDKPQPTIPSSEGTMGHEEEAGLSGGDDRYTGGDKGQGKTETASIDDDLYHMKGFGSSKDGISSLAERIAKKLAPKEPVAKDPDIQPISDKGTIGKEEKFDAEEINESEVKSDSGMIGHEKETLKDKPDSPKDHPDVHTGNAQMGEEELDSEKTTKDKGTVIAESDSEPEAYRVAARMLQTKKIEASQLQDKIDELKTYKLEQIKDIEKAIFSSEKGLNTDSDGKLSQTVQINETSSVRNAQDELSSKLTSMFTLGKQNRIADDDSLTQLRITYNK